MQSAYEALGFRFRVDTADTGLAGHVDRLLAGCRSSVTEAGPLLPVDDSPGSLISLVGTVNMRAIGAAGGSLLLHAGAVCRADGRAAVLCGPSGSGKSTFTAVLAGRGLAYVTDETVCLAPESLRITPFRKPLSLKAGSHHVLPHLRPPADPHLVRGSGGQWLVPPPALGGPPLPAGPLLPDVLVFPTHTPGAAVQVDRVPAAEAAYTLGGNTSRLRDVRDRGLPALARLVRRAPAYRVVYEDVHAAADAVQDLWDRVA